MKIKIVSPSGAIDPQYIDRATEVLRGWGYEVSEAAHARGKVGRFAASDEERVADIAEALTDPAVDMILCARGGYGLQRIIDLIPPIHKPIIGFSDITALHCLMGHAGRTSIHGAMCKALASDADADRQSAQALQRLILGEPLRYQLSAHPLNRQGKAAGNLRGGNLSILYSLQGSPYACPVSEGDILFIEDIGEHPYAIDRMMQNLRLSGMLSRIGGLIVGQFSDYEEDPRMPYSVYEGIRNMVEQYDYPVWFDFPSGHTDFNMPILLNSPCQMQVCSTECLLTF